MVNRDRVSQQQNVEQKIAWLLDKSIQLPGGYRVGLDAILGLIPGVGDTLGLVLSSWIIWQGFREGASKSLLVWMLINVGIDSLVGMVPVVGDLFDFVWKANDKNVELLEQHRQNQAVAKKASQRYLLGVGLIAALLCMVLFLGSVQLLMMIWGWLSPWLAIPPTAYGV